MPELPEVETVRRSLASSILNIPIVDVVVHHPRLRYPIPENLRALLCETYFTKVTRRGKYLLLHTARTIGKITENVIGDCVLRNNGAVLIHLGMSGKLLLQPQTTPLIKHEHVTLTFANGHSLRFIDPRRFGALLWTSLSAPEKHHPILLSLGTEPLSAAFTAHYLYRLCQHHQRHRHHRQRARTTIKQLIMNGSNVVGVGNIYASEALFLSGIAPQRHAVTLSESECEYLVKAIKLVLRQAIKHGGTTIRDFVSGNGARGNFVYHLQVYGRAGEACYKCGTVLKMLRLGQRSTVYCSKCQK